MNFNYKHSTYHLRKEEELKSNYIYNIKTLLCFIRISSLSAVDWTIPVAAEPVQNALFVEVVPTALHFAHLQVASILLEESSSVEPGKANSAFLIY